MSYIFSFHTKLYLITIPIFQNNICTDKTQGYDFKIIIYGVKTKKIIRDK